MVVLFIYYFKINICRNQPTTYQKRIYFVKLVPVMACLHSTTLNTGVQAPGLGQRSKSRTSLRFVLFLVKLLVVEQKVSYEPRCEKNGLRDF